METDDELSRPDWETDGADWPNRAASRFVEAGGVRWHVQLCGAGPAVLLLHGSGASTHSWERLIPALSRRFTVVAPDLPGHAFSSAPPAARMSMPAVAESVAALLRALGLRPALAVGHSAGAAIAVRMTIDGLISPLAIVGLNPALAAMDPPGGVLRPLVTAIACSGVTARLVARFAIAAAVGVTLESTGSRLDPRAIELYRRLASSPAHVNGVMTMFSQWEVEPLVRDFARLRVPTTLVFGEGDRWIVRDEVERAAAAIPDVRFAAVPGTGHLSHEERPDAVLRIILDAALAAGVEAAA